MERLDSNIFNFAYEMALRDATLQGAYSGTDKKALRKNKDAKIAVNGTEAIHTMTKQITNEGDMTLVNLKVTAANDITTVGKKLAIIEKSDNAGL